MGSFNRPHPGAARCHSLPQERVLRAGAGDWPRPKSPAAGPHGVFKQALTAGPEEFKPFPRRSPKKMVDIPNALWYPSCRNGNHANAGAARGHRGREGRQNEECRMQNEGAARGDKPLQNARNTEKAKPVRNDRQPSQIGHAKAY